MLKSLLEPFYLKITYAHIYIYVYVNHGFGSGSMLHIISEFMTHTARPIFCTVITVRGTPAVGRISSIQQPMPSRSKFCDGNQHIDNIPTWKNEVSYDKAMAYDLFVCYML